MGRRRGPSLTREDVVAAAVAVVLAEGPDALGVSRVARELGIQPPSLYNHVGSGDELAWAAVIAGNRLLLARLVEATRGVVDPRDQVRALARATRQWVFEHRGLYALMARIEPDVADAEFGPVMRETLDLFAGPLTTLGVAPADMLHALRGLRAVMHGFVLLELGGQFRLAEDPEVSYAWVVEAAIRGLEAIR